jgi:hypothetical protein
MACDRGAAAAARGRPDETQAGEAPAARHSPNWSNGQPRARVFSTEATRDASPRVSAASLARQVDSSRRTARRVKASPSGPVHDLDAAAAGQHHPPAIRHAMTMSTAQSSTRRGLGPDGTTARHLHYMRTDSTRVSTHALMQVQRSTSDAITAAYCGGRPTLRSGMSRARPGARGGPAGQRREMTPARVERT